jgi:hypothetical protein
MLRSDAGGWIVGWMISRDQRHKPLRQQIVSDLASGWKFFQVFAAYLTAMLFLRKLAVLLGRP